MGTWEGRKVMNSLGKARAHGRPSSQRRPANGGEPLATFGGWDWAQGCQALTPQPEGATLQGKDAAGVSQDEVLLDGQVGPEFSPKYP